MRICDWCRSEQGVEEIAVKIYTTRNQTITVLMPLTELCFNHRQLISENVINLVKGMAKASKKSISSAVDVDKEIIGPYDG